MLKFDNEGARRTEKLYASPDVEAQRKHVLSLLAPQAGECVLDVGSGPGYLVASIAEAVGPTGAVHGVDPSSAMNSLAAARAADMPWVHFEECGANALPFADGVFDAAVSTQVYEYVADISGALRELRRVLRPGGRALVLDTDADSLVWHTSDRLLHRRVLAAWEDHLVHPRLPRVLAGLMRRAGFHVTEQLVHVMFNAQMTPDAFSTSYMNSIAQFVVGRRGLTAAEVEAWLTDLRARNDEGDYLYSINRYMFLATAA
ncbi:methyltransferase domain-containing protein [Pseudonocardia alaniniphila]|uniref:Methyltransferase domain-containing protein n=1 Tax=Pseudonocardia alaniniphila TaxID=75291 RepID=A0ABS9TUZ4_9PSEU|nr:methyltransferase domain-containing protein [Pseudonocardia alaniniphila]MCH6172316.1 methyltransferase domain-containing protein [Pseudonocardia alaniniphila]